MKIKKYLKYENKEILEDEEILILSFKLIGPNFYEAVWVFTPAYRWIYRWANKSFYEQGGICKKMRIDLRRSMKEKPTRKRDFLIWLMEQTMTEGK